MNVLVAASRSDHPHHAVAHSWLVRAVEMAPVAAPLTLQPMAAASFLRLVTHPKIFVNPTPTAEAVGFVEALLGMPGVSVPTLGDEWPILRKLCIDNALAANDLPDAWLAAAVIQQGEHLVTFDRDFRRLLARSQFTLLKAT
ncbi:TA system VapC family ribonuclease toxin [Variovorax sp. HW608]|uniref:TA system VapC family ribonuclease toxin n=1 Tax=Variovorax sp. HW608 TaxID=1034889 RepID=UPI001E5139F0|nr:TA system VapC family ribonuclease toxin [Variovorax sp. HW608]